MAQARKRIGEQLVEAGMLTVDQLNTAIEYQKSLGGTIGQIVVKLNFISDHELTKFLSRQFGIPIVDLAAMVLPLDLIKKVPLELIEKHQMIPVHQTRRTLTIATADPTDYGAIEEIQYATGLQIELNLAPRAALVKSIREVQGNLRGDKGAVAKTRKDPSQPALVTAPRQGGESGLIDDLRARGGGKIAPAELSKADMREALIPALLKKGVISRAELYDAVLEIMVRKGVITENDMREVLKGL